MRLFLVGLACIACTGSLHAQPKAKDPDHVGEVIIVGNTITQDRVIRDVLDFYPGQILDRAKLRAAEKKLEQLGLFQVDAKAKIRPTIQVLDAPGPFKDILIRVEERATTASIKPIFVAEPSIGFGVALVLEERHFDLWRFPTSLDDLREGRAWRGGGETFRMGIAMSAFVGPRIHWSWVGRQIPASTTVDDAKVPQVPLKPTLPDLRKGP